MDINSSKAQAIHAKIGEMIAIDYQPFSIVEDQGFINLMSHLEPRCTMPSPKYFTETVIPKIYEKVKQSVVLEITNATNVSLTTDIWSTDLNSSSLLSLTAQWLTPKFELKNAVLHVHQFDGSHTGDAIRVSN